MVICHGLLTTLIYLSVTAGWLNKYSLQTCGTRRVVPSSSVLRNEEIMGRDNTRGMYREELPFSHFHRHKNGVSMLFEEPRRIQLVSSHWRRIINVNGYCLALFDGVAYILMITVLMWSSSSFPLIMMSARPWHPHPYCDGWDSVYFVPMLLSKPDSVGSTMKCQAQNQHFNKTDLLIPLQHLCPNLIIILCKGVL